MKWTYLTGLGLAASAYADGVTGNVAPDGNAPDGCSSSYDGQFEVTVSTLGKRTIEKRSCDNPNALLLTLSDGVLKDAKGRTGYIASSFQFQFDAPPQAGAIYTAGFSACSNGALALGSSTQWWQCLSGDFYNLYDRNWAAQCEAVEIVILPCGGGGSTGGNGGSNAGGNSNGDGQVTVGSSVVHTTVVTAISDGQPQVHTTTVAVPICQISDGQIQGHPTPCVSGPAVTQITDGQPQAPTGAPPVTQISDGQPQAPAGSPAAPSGPVITQISDGQPQVPAGNATPSVVPVVPPPQPPAVNTTSAVPVVPTAPTQVPVTPVPSASPTQVPVSGASQCLPGVMAALAVVLGGFLAL